MSDETAKDEKQATEAALVNDTEKLALYEENQRLAKELADLKAKTNVPSREAKRYESGMEVPANCGVFAVELQAPVKNNQLNPEILYVAEIVAVDEAEALRQAMSELCDKKQWQQPPSWLVRKVSATEETLKQREDRIRFRKWRKANDAREERGENLLPLPPNLTQFKDQLTDTERYATEGLQTVK